MFIQLDIEKQYIFEQNSNNKKKKSNINLNIHFSFFTFYILHIYVYTHKHCRLKFHFGRGAHERDGKQKTRDFITDTSEHPAENTAPVQVYCTNSFCIRLKIVSFSARGSRLLATRGRIFVNVGQRPASVI